ncbi:MAG: glycosyltransferase family 2 protein, partial [Acidobacteriota bacterium]
HNAWHGAPLDDVAGGILASEEFRGIADACLNLDFTYRQAQRSPHDRGLAAEELVRNGASMPRTHLWHDLLLSGLEWVRGIVPDESLPEVVGPVVEALKSNFVGVVDIDELIDQKFAFNPAWFVAANQGVPGLDRVAAADLEAFAAQAVWSGEAEISPFFEIAGDGRATVRRKIFEPAYEDESPSLDALLEQVVIAAKNGLLEHWLFDEFTYIRERKKAFAPGLSDSWEPIASPYLDFLINGDARAIRPHPLFCPVAYNSFNAYSNEESGAFAHFLQVGQFLGYRTSALFDPDYYNALNPLAKLDLENGRYCSAIESYCKEGLSKGLPFSPDFNADYYSRTYEDVARGLKERTVNAAWHFLREGAYEGRRGTPYFDPQYYARRYPFIDKICRDSSISVLEHFLLFGRFDGMRPSEPLLDREIDILQAKGLYERRALDALIRLSRRPLDFTHFTAQDPLVSIIVPVHNQISFTARFLELAYFACAELKRRTSASCEIIVVSNGSTDKTDEFVKSFSGIKSVISAETLGYPRAVNEGAKLADAQYLLIVNNDVEFDPGIFADLVESFSETPDCGALGPRILSMDMTIQEAGSFIAPNGSTFGFGRGTRSSTLSGTNRDVVDYVSGCFLFLERQDFEALGGFDEAFSPGYYEEVDLCLRIASELGKQAVLDLGISILHYENASFMKGRPPEASHALIVRNRQKIMLKHPRISETLSLQKFRVPAGATAIGGARNVRVLVIDDLIPDPRLGSGFGRTAEVLRVFHDVGVAFDVMALHPTPAVDEYEFPDVALYRDWMPGQSLEELLQADAAPYSHIWLCGPQNVGRLAPSLEAYKSRHEALIICDIGAIGIEGVVKAAPISDGTHLDGQTRDMLPVGLPELAIVDRFITANEVDVATIRSAGISKVSIRRTD